MIEPGSRVVLSYPTSTHVRLIDVAKRKQRHVIVSSVRDLMTDPLTIDEFLRRPFTSRSRWLVAGWDCFLRRWRQFYLGSSDEYRSPGTLKIALYSQDGKIVDVIGRSFDPHTYDRKVMIDLLLRCKDQDFGDFTVGITSDDMRIVA